MPSAREGYADGSGSTTGSGRRRAGVVVEPAWISSLLLNCGGKQRPSDPAPGHRAVGRVQLDPQKAAPVTERHHPHGAGAGEWVENEGWGGRGVTCAGRLPALRLRD